MKVNKAQRPKAVWIPRDESNKGRSPLNSCSLYVQGSHKGNIALGVQVVRDLGNPQYVNMYVNYEEKCFIVSPTDEGSAYALKVLKNGGNKNLLKHSNFCETIVDKFGYKLKSDTTRLVFTGQLLQDDEGLYYRFSALTGELRGAKNV